MVNECFNSSFKQQQQQQHRTTNSETMKCEMGKKPKHSSKAMSFIKVLARDFSKQLQLPEEFTTNLNGYVPHRFIIESSLTRRCWRVEVDKDDDGRIFFRDGWADFVEAHSLEVGNFLLFEYEEQSIFQVRIYGRNGFERTILPDSKGGQHKPQTIIDDDDDGEKSEAVENEPVLVKCRQQKTRLAPRKNGKGIWKKKHAVRRPYKRTSLVSAKVGQDDSCFSIKIHHSKKHQFSQLTVPKAVSLKMKLPSKQKLKFQDAQGKCWPVTLGHRRDGRAIFSQGWKELMKDNKVAPGDNLKFEFSDEIVRFHVTKASKAEHQSDDEETGSLNMDCTPRTPSACRASNPTSNARQHCESGSSFSLTWRESIARTYLYMPQSVVRGQHLTNKDSIALRDPEGKCWPLEVKKLSGNRVVLTKGWVEFWKGHGITTGDLLQFNFVSEYLIQVTINRGNYPLNEADVEGAVICLEDAKDNEDVVAIEQEPIISQEEFDDAINQAVITREEFDAAVPFPQN